MNRHRLKASYEESQKRMPSMLELLLVAPLVKFPVPVPCDIIISPRSQWEEYNCPDCDKLMDDPVLTSCGHRMCYKCFDKRRSDSGDPLCPVRDDDGQEHKKSPDDWSLIRTAEWKINELLVKCKNCKVECTVERYRKYGCSTRHDAGINSILINPRSQWEKYICPACDELMDDPVLTSCGHRMCYECFDKRRRGYGQRCPVGDDDGQKHEMSLDDWSRDRTAEWKISKLLVKCEKCKMECTVKRYREFDCSTGHDKGLPPVTRDMIISPRSQWEKYICPDCNELMDGPVLTSCGQQMCHKCLDKKRRSIFGPWYHAVRDDDGLRYKISLDDRSRDRTAEEKINELLVKYDQCGIKCSVSVGRYRQLVQFSLDQQREIIIHVLKKELPSAKRDLSIDELRPLLYQNEVITHEEANELLGVSTGEEKVTRLYTEMLPNKGLQGLEQYMKILYDTGWDTPSHMRHHGVLAIALSEKLSQIKASVPVVDQNKIKEAAREAIVTMVPMVYSESLPDAVVNLSMSINKLLLPMLKRRLVTTMEYFWLRQTFCPGEKLEYLYKEVLPQKGVEGFKAFMEILQDVGT